VLVRLGQEVQEVPRGLKRIAAIGTIAAVAFAGCGGGSDEAASVARDYLEAQAARDGDTACALLTEEGIGEVGTSIEDPGLDDCVAFIDGIPGDGFEIGEVELVNDADGKATVQAETTHGELAPETRVMILVESDGEWLVDDPAYDSATEAEIE
jgi:hypothetical protein